MAGMDDLQAMIAAAVADAIAGTLPGSPGNEPAKPATRKGKAAKPATRKAAPKVAASCITAGIAWELLGGDPKFTPKDPSRPATNAQLWSLNAAGLLSVNQ